VVQPTREVWNSMQGPEPDIGKAVALFRAGNGAAAAQACKAILHRNDRDVAALYLLALTAMQQRDCTEAECIFAKVTKLEPNSAEIWANRGNNLIAMSKLDHALHAFDRALAIEPMFLEALYNRGKLLNDAGQLEEALASYDKCLAIMPRFADALHNRGIVLAQLRRYDEALASFDRCLAIAPNAPDTLHNRGNLLATLKRYDEALASYDKCITLAPAFAQAWIDVGMLLVRVKRYEEAAKVLGRALELDPNAKYVLSYLMYARQQVCDWGDLPRLKSKLLDCVQKDEPTSPPFVLLAATDSPRLQLQCAQAQVAKEHPPADRTRMFWRGERYAHERIRIAYLSADFRDHAVARLIAGLFEHHDRTKFEITAISFVADNSDSMQGRIKRACDRYIEVSKRSDRDVAHLLRELEIDIAVDLMGFTQDSRLGILGYRPAPIQVNYLGYAGTMGAGYVDYVIADRRVLPPGQESCWTEKIVHLPDTFMATDGTTKVADTAPTRAVAGLPQDGFVFCVFNQPFKITPEVFDVWMRLLRRVDGSVLWLTDARSTTARNLRQEAERRGVAADRLLFAERVSRHEDHLARHRLADLFLDTLPYNAHTTACDALWTGLPVVTCLGATFAGRVAASLLHAIGLDELVTTSLAEYEALAVKIATTPALLGALREKLAAQRGTHALFDTERFRRHIECAFITMHERHLRGEPAAHFSVSSVERQG
jgi:protein O-GlcNAc transferase